jgi:Rieske 2Fe-2S family protein
MLPSDAKPGGKGPHDKFSVVQLGMSGNTPVFRCPYHAWTYDTGGALMYLPPGAPQGFDQKQYGLHPITLKVVEGFIYVTFSDNPPDFETWIGGMPQRMKDFHTADLKYAVRRSVPNKANWKLVIENFRECYHCGPAHRNSYVTAHWFGDGQLTAAERARIEGEIAREGHPGWQPETPDAYFWQQRTVTTELYNRRTTAPAGDGMITPRRRHFRPGYVTATLDGKPASRLLPGFTAYNHGMGTGKTYSGGSSGFSTSNIFFYEDHVVGCRFTPRAVDLTDVEIFYLVHPEAEEGKDYNVDHLIGLWYETLREDRWVGENNHHGILSSRYAYKGGQPYMTVEGGPAGFVQWYMRDVVSEKSA